MVSMHRPASPEPIDPPPRMYRIATPGPVEEDEDEPLDIPQVAARYTSPPPPDLFTADEEEPFDVSEVLVRTGQASRLRRRGAIRIEAGRTPLTRRDNTSTVSLATTVPDDDLRYFQRDEGPTLESVTRWRGVTAQDFTDGRPLYCGGMAPRRPPSPRDTTSPLPIPSKSTRRTRTTPINSTGCGALVHDTASASERLSLWLANTPARPVVAPLEAQYVQRGPYGTLHPGTARCGCVNQGVGCTAW
ncbi:hypothetical protein FRB99_001013 [Tulasnella sp. 403]|nr:hypothetical protein FRB99_001013 [Tulasnella sp. 403]